MPDFYSPVSFFFRVDFETIRNVDKDIAFQSVSGLDVSLETESFKEGGENRFEHVFPTRSKYSDLVLKRGMIGPENSGLTDWCVMAFENNIYQPINLTVILLNEKGNPLMHWEVVHAWPKSWKINELNAEKSEIFIETLELNYNFYKVRKG